MRRDERAAVIFMKDTLKSKGILTTIGHIEESIVITVLTIEFPHKGARGRQRVIAKYEERLVRGK